MFPPVVQIILWKNQNFHLFSYNIWNAWVKHVQMGRVTLIVRDDIDIINSLYFVNRYIYTC